ncbi:hypothetical protein WQ54_18150 [Bacillus sp. SA1-12]|uniref:AraC family transcriptional regulator n=1 Tax=Bacillus sp. SA1-12 TaxID=1455638 RepID=UPI000627137B|nr:AraC family transcriptional regulator [Bacillus sp. SA1-12]KKI90852.1 hypothetical protein WQ54_18150 [Bacillus sp. SA1-12]
MVLPHIEMAGEFIIKPGWMLGPRSLTEYEIVYFPNGSNTKYEVHDHTYLLKKPGFIITRPFEEHMYIFDPIQPTRHLFIHFNFDISKSNSPINDLFLKENSYLTVEEVSLVPPMLKHILYLANTRAFQWYERCNYLLLSALVELNSTTVENKTESNFYNKPRQIIKALDFIDKNLTKNLTVAEIAHCTGWSHEHFTRIFTEHIGLPPQKAIMYRRIERSCQLLLQEQWSIKRIAFAVGFKDEHYFSRSFLKVKGMTATQYRNKYADSRLHHLATTEEYSSPYPLNKYILFNN